MSTQRRTSQGGWLVDGVGLRTALVIGGAGYLFATLLPFTSRHWRAMDERPAPAATEPEASPEPARA